MERQDQTLQSEMQNLFPEAQVSSSTAAEDPSVESVQIAFSDMTGIADAVDSLLMSGHRVSIMIEQGGAVLSYTFENRSDASGFLQNPGDGIQIHPTIYIG